jgi:hypothetical protein
MLWRWRLARKLDPPSPKANKGLHLRSQPRNKSRKAPWRVLRSSGFDFRPYEVGGIPAHRHIAVLSIDVIWVSLSALYSCWHSSLAEPPTAGADFLVHIIDRAVVVRPSGGEVSRSLFHWDAPPVSFGSRSAVIFSGIRDGREHSPLRPCRVNRHGAGQLEPVRGQHPRR